MRGIHSVRRALPAVRSARHGGGERHSLRRDDGRATNAGFGAAATRPAPGITSPSARCTRRKQVGPAFVVARYVRTQFCAGSVIGCFPVNGKRPPHPPDTRPLSACARNRVGSRGGFGASEPCDRREWVAYGDRPDSCAIRLRCPVQTHQGRAHFGKSDQRRANHVCFPGIGVTERSAIYAPGMSRWDDRQA